MPSAREYAVSGAAFAVSFAFSIAALARPEWLSYTETLDDGELLSVHLGLNKKCSSLTGKCTPFPERDDCAGDEEFCVGWKSAGFAMWFIMVLNLAVALSFINIALGGYAKRTSGYRILAPLIVLVGLLQVSTLAIPLFMYFHESRFALKHWHLGISWFLDGAAIIIAIINGVGLFIVGRIYSDDYEPIP